MRFDCETRGKVGEQAEDSRLAIGPPVIMVSELNRSMRQSLEQGFPPMWVAGEVSNFSCAASGHWYFSLKDATAQVRCVAFRHRNAYLDWMPENGVQVEVYAQVSLYEPRGDFQLNVEGMRRAGLGALFEAFARLKERLGKEGLFDLGRKRPLPPFPGRVGVVTSRDGAALHDVLTTLRRRMPAIEVIVYPTPVQGEGAAQQIAAAIANAGARAECDVLIVCRGGGSIEDLWAFNEEIVARAVCACPIPVVSAIGHESDFTICDFVADVRAPTPTAAAELVSPNRDELRARLSALQRRLERLATAFIENRMQHLDHLSRRLTHPGQRLEHQSQRLQQAAARLSYTLERVLEARRWTLGQWTQRLAAVRPDPAAPEARCWRIAERLQTGVTVRLDLLHGDLQRLGDALNHLNPQSVLRRGFSIARQADGTIVRSSTQVAVGDSVTLTLAEGWVGAQITEKNQS